MKLSRRRRGTRSEITITWTAKNQLAAPETKSARRELFKKQIRSKRLRYIGLLLENLPERKHNIFFSLKIRMYISENSMPGFVQGSCVCLFKGSRSTVGGASRSSLITASQILTPPQSSREMPATTRKAVLTLPPPGKSHTAPQRALHKLGLLKDNVSFQLCSEKMQI